MLVAHAHHAQVSLLAEVDRHFVARACMPGRGVSCYMHIYIHRYIYEIDGHLVARASAAPQVSVFVLLY